MTPRVLEGKLRHSMMRSHFSWAWRHGPLRKMQGEQLSSVICAVTGYLSLVDCFKQNQLEIDSTVTILLKMRHRKENSLLVPGRCLTGNPQLLLTQFKQWGTHRCGRLRGSLVLEKWQTPLASTWDSPTPYCTLHLVCFRMLRPQLDFEASVSFGNPYLSGHKIMYVVKTSSSNNL